MNTPSVTKAPDYMNLRGFAEILVRDRSLKVLEVIKATNIVTDLARISQLKNWVGGGMTGMVTFNFLGVGSGSTAAASTQTALGTELTAGPGGVRYTTTSTVPAAFANTDVVADTSVSPYTQHLIQQAIMDFGDGNNGSNVRELALFSSATFASGTMGNRIVLGSDIPKTADIQLVINIIMRM